MSFNFNVPLGNCALNIPWPLTFESKRKIYWKTSNEVPIRELNVAFLTEIKLHTS